MPTVAATIDIAAINSADRKAFVAALGNVFEHSPWVAERSYERRPFAGADALHEAMMQCVRQASREQQLALIRAHPELAGREASAGGLTADSTSEQGRLGITALSGAEVSRMAEINRRYREKFGFPCIVALRLHATRAAVIAEMERRMGNDLVAEVGNAIEQIGHITRGRLERMFGRS